MRQQARHVTVDIWREAKRGTLHPRPPVPHIGAIDRSALSTARSASASLSLADVDMTAVVCVVVLPEVLLAFVAWRLQLGALEHFVLALFVPVAVIYLSRSRDTTFSLSSPSGTRPGARMRWAPGASRSSGRAGP
jgi:hypothetical protein